MSDFVTLDEIEAQAPNTGNAGPMAFYSVRCCWWTTDRDDIGTSSATDDGHMGGLPCCPHCGSMLWQTPLSEFLASVRSIPDHYGEFKLKALAKAHAANVQGCAPLWGVYNFMLEVERDLGVRTGWLAQVNLVGPGRVEICERKKREGE